MDRLPSLVLLVEGRNAKPSKEERIMKPSRIAILIAVILLVVGGTTAFAASSSAVQQPNTNCAFRDADGNGICDVCGAAQTAATCSRCGNHYTNADGQALAQELDLRFLDCAAALEAILSSDTVSALLAQDSALTIAVSGQDEAQCQDLLTQAQHCTAGQENAHCFSASSREHDEAHQAGLTLGKYRAYLALHDLDPTVTPEEVQTLTMAEIRDRIQALGGTLPTGSGEHSQTQAGHHGQGHHSE